jgi:hypothetical protein
VILVSFCHLIDPSWGEFCVRSDLAMIQEEVESWKLGSGSGSGSGKGSGNGLAFASVKTYAKSCEAFNFPPLSYFRLLSNEATHLASQKYLLHATL